ncbi:MAG: C40 family peptidase, partial [Candidatus Gallimonas sp.]
MKRKPISFALAAILFAVPLGACGEKQPPLSENEAPAELPDAEDASSESFAPPSETTDEIPSEDTDADPSESESVPEPDPEPEPEPEPTPPAPATTPYVLILTNGLNVRSGAGTSYSSLGQADYGLLLKYTGKTGNWYITYYRGKTAYVSADSAYTSLSQLETGNAATEQVVEHGMRLLGTPYVYGAVRLHDGYGNKLKGFTTSKFDCSSLMQYIFYEGAHVLLATTSRTQSLQGKAVAAGEIRRGDLLFFT